jgi:hypothetical protein
MLSSPTTGEDSKHGRFLWVRMTGPLAPYASGLAGELARLGLTEGSAKGQLGLAAHLSRWLVALAVGTDALTGPTVEEYLVARRAARYKAYLTQKALALLLGYLRAGPSPGGRERSAGDTDRGAAGGVPLLPAGRA